LVANFAYSTPTLSFLLGKRKRGKGKEKEKEGEVARAQIPFASSCGRGERKERGKGREHREAVPHLVSICLKSGKKREKGGKKKEKRKKRATSSRSNDPPFPIRGGKKGEEKREKRGKRPADLFQSLLITKIRWRKKRGERGWGEQANVGDPNDLAEFFGKKKRGKKKKKKRGRGRKRTGKKSFLQPSRRCRCDLWEKGRRKKKKKEGGEKEEEGRRKVDASGALPNRFTLIPCNFERRERGGRKKRERALAFLRLPSGKREGKRGGESGGVSFGKKRRVEGRRERKKREGWASVIAI